jgi:hypothetical protein
MTDRQASINEHVFMLLFSFVVRYDSTTTLDYYTVYEYRVPYYYCTVRRLLYRLQCIYCTCTYCTLETLARVVFFSLL